MRWIAHVDMDAFFAQVEQSERPELRGRPVVVANGTPEGRGVVAAASYEARAFGIRSAMPLRSAARRCPEMLLVRPRMERYRELSGEVMEELRAFSDLVEVLGLDEAYVDLSESPTPKARARAMKERIRSRTGLICSVGLGPSKLLAKIASDLDKPDGFAVLPLAEMLERIGGRPATLIPGVGPKTAQRLRAVGIVTVADLAGATEPSLAQVLGVRRAQELSRLARGHDERSVVPERRRKSESRERTFDADVEDVEVLRRALGEMAADLGARVEAHGYSFRTVTLKIRLAPFRTHTRSRTLPAPAGGGPAIRETALELLDEFPRDAAVRLVGVGVSGLSEEGEGGRPPDLTLGA